MEEGVLQAYYANLIAYRVTPNELVLEFGNFFQKQDGTRTEADHRDFDIRVVMNSDAIDGMINLLTQAKNAYSAIRTQKPFAQPL